MPLVQYATLDQLGTWLTDWLPDGTVLPDNLPAQLRSATIIVARSCNRQPYTDTPAEPDADALRDATCAQVQAWVALGIDPATTGLGSDEAPVRSSTILGATVVRDTTGLVAERTAVVADLVPEAAAILQQAGLLWQPGPQQDPCATQLPTWGQQPHRWPSPFRDPLSGEIELSGVWLLS